LQPLKSTALGPEKQELEPVSKRFSLFKVKAGDPSCGGINRMNTLSILRIKI